MQHKTKPWLRHWEFYSVTGLPPDHVRFCLERPQKAAHCRQLKITHFIDGRLDVLTALRKDVPFLYLSGEQPAAQEIPGWAAHALNWDEAAEAVLRQLRSSGS